MKKYPSTQGLLENFGGGEPLFCPKQVFERHRHGEKRNTSTDCRLPNQSIGVNFFGAKL
jgi:hypothetical protein